jgi:hypothetical protein
MRKIIFLTIIIVGCFFWSLATCKAGFDDLGPYFSFTWGDGGGIPSDVSNITSQQTSTDGQTVTLSGDLGPIAGANFGNGFVFYWNGGFQGPINPGDQFVTGGSLSWSYYSDLWSNEGYESARILTDLTPTLSSGEINGVQLVSSQFTQPGETGNFEGYLNIEWSGFSPTDTFSIDVNSIDISYLPAPEPSTLGLLAVGVGALLVRRHKHFQLTTP